MRHQTSIFITYNPKSDEEQTLAVRLHTIGAVYGFKMMLPDRFESTNPLTEETKYRIDAADWIVIFSMKALSPTVKQEIEYAFHRLKDKSKIIVIYNKEKGKNLSGPLTNYFTEIYFNPVVDSVDTVTSAILNRIFNKDLHEVNQKTLVHQKEIQNLKRQNETNKGLLALLAVGLGLYALSSLSKD